ncbi:MAG: acylphosphatase [Actinomycetota bacterium]
MRHVRIVVRGRVQGVFFRASFADLARRLDLGGWVTNRPDGAVEAVVSGSDEAVAQAIAWCRRGPELASVDSVEISEEPGTLREHGFRVS